MLARASAFALPLRDGVAQTIVTSPPYWGLRVYADAAPDALGMEPTVEEYVARMVAVGDECARVLRDDGTLWLVIGDTYHANAGARDGERKQGAKMSAAQRVERTGRARARAKSLALVPQRLAVAFADAGWFVRSEVIWSKPNALPEPVKDRPVRAHETVWLFTKRRRYAFNAEALREPSVSGVAGSGNVRRQPTLGSVKGRMASVPWRNEGWRNGRSVWSINSVRVPGHSAAFPPELAARCIEAGSAAGDVVVDPFVGLGTTVRVAEALGRRGLGFDLSPTYLAAAR